MRNRFALLALLVVCLAMVGCASKKKDTQLDPSVAQYERFRQNYDAALKRCTQTRSGRRTDL